MRLLKRLRDALEARGVPACLRPGTEALLVYGPRRTLPTWVFIGYGGTQFAWHSAERRHSVKDVLGAAEALKAYVEQVEPGPPL